MHSLININYDLNFIILTSLSVKELILKRFKSSYIFLRSIRLLSNKNEKKVLKASSKKMVIKGLITSSVINKILINQNLSVTDLKLEKLLKVKGIEVDLSSFPTFNRETLDLLDESAGKSKYKGYSGVYMFIHKETNSKYVGSSNLLRRRLDYYFKGNYPLAGKFLPFLKAKGLKAFKLIIFKLDNEKFKNDDALILEQYYLLNKEEYNLNMLRVVNAGSSKGDPVYVYDLNAKVLYYHAKSRNELKRVLNVHPETSKKYRDSKMPYLNKFLLLSHPVSTIESNISTEKLKDMMQEERKQSYLLGTRRKIKVELEIIQGNKLFSSSREGESLKFDSLTLCHEYLKGLGFLFKRDSLTKYIKNGKIFSNFKAKYSEKTLPNNFKELGLVIDEYKSFASKKKKKN